MIRTIGALVGALVLTQIGAGCSAQRALAPDPPRVSAVKPTDMAIRLRTLQLYGEPVEEGDLDERLRMRVRLLDHLRSQLQLADLSDVSLAYEGDGAPRPATRTLDLAVRVQVSHTKRRNWFLHAIAAYPCFGLLPFTPLEGACDVGISGTLSEGGQVVWQGQAAARQPWDMLLYSWYRTEPIEEAYRQAGAQAFAAFARDLAAQQAPSANADAAAAAALRPSGRPGWLDADAAPCDEQGGTLDGRRHANAGGLWGWALAGVVVPPAAGIATLVEAGPRRVPTAIGVSALATAGVLLVSAIDLDAGVDHEDAGRQGRCSGVPAYGVAYEYAYALRRRQMNMRTVVVAGGSSWASFSLTTAMIAAVTRSIPGGGGPR